MKIMLASNAPFVSSGYGVQAALFGQRFTRLGHDVAYYANFGVSGKTLDWNGCRIYPADGAWGRRTMAACAAQHGDGLEDCQIIALCDAWLLHPEELPDGTRLAVWAPVDQYPLPSQTRLVLEHPLVTPIAMSRFGEQMMRDAGLDPAYVPHGVDCDLFAPAPEIRSDARAEAGLHEDAFVVGMVAANRGSPIFSRKAFPQVFQAFARFRETRRDAVLYVHTNEMIEKDDGILLRSLGNACGIPRQALRITPAFEWELGIERATLARLYETFDVLCSPSFGEGFGVPIIEAQASGVPVIVTDHSAMTELCGAGWLVDGEPWWNAANDSWFKCPSVDDIVDALEQAYELRDDQELRAKARAFALGYDADRVAAEHWVPTLERLSGEVGPLQVARQTVAV